MEPPDGPDRTRGEDSPKRTATVVAPLPINLKTYFLAALISSLAIVFVSITLMFAISNIGDVWFDAASEQEVVDHGAAYDVEIGRTKAQTFQYLKSLTLDEPLIVSGVGMANFPNRYLLSDEVAYDILMGSDHWHLLFDTTTIDVLRLHFTDGNLSKIIRVRTPEMPRKR
ncbi:MAG: hypothetical protein VCC99_02095 [Alphaproteobacteria bacterium]